MFSSFGKVLWCTKCTDRTAIHHRMFCAKSNLNSAYQMPGVHLITPQLLNIIGDFGRYNRRYNTATYEEVRDGAKSHNVWIIDVRDKKEIERSGAIENAINIPRIPMAAKVVTYEEVKHIRDNQFLIDVRNKNEIAETGLMPHAYNIPLPELGETFGLDDNAFLAKVGRKKPSKDASIIFTCRSGARALKAANEIIGLGYTNVSYYKGSWIEWAEKQAGEKKARA